MKFTLLASLLSAAAAFAPVPSSRPATVLHESKEDLKSLANKLNPVVGYVQYVWFAFISSFFSFSFIFLLTLFWSFDSSST